jgi:diguanylate cyclase (GGDEF)-like protein
VLHTIRHGLKQAHNAHTRHLPGHVSAQVRVVNLLAIMGVGLSGLYTALYGIVFQSPPAAGLNIVFTLAYLGYFWVLPRGGLQASRIWITLVFVVQVGVFLLWAFPQESGYHLHVIAGIPFAFLVFPHPERWWRAATVVALLGIFFVAEWWNPPKLFGEHPRVYARATYLLVVPVIALLVAVVLQSFLNELHRRDEALQQLAVTDVLTGIANRRGWMERAQAMLAQAQRMGSPACLVMVDIDHFKPVNDRYGHLVGDRLLAAVAQALHDNVRLEDVVGRMGGEEFAVLLWNTRLAEAVRVAEQLRTRAAAVSVPDETGGSIGCSISLGVAEVSSPGEALDRVLARADLALYTAKAAGRNRVFPAPEA